MSRLLFRLAPVLAVLSTVPLIVLTGCGAATSFSNPTASARVSGKIFGGQQPVAGSTVTVWAAGIAGYGSPAISLATATSGDDGSFTITTPYTCTPGEQVYITASGGTSVAASGNNANIMLATGLGDCAAAQTATVEINEVTTAVTAFALAQFFTTNLGSSSPDSFGTDPADLIAFTNSNQYTIPTLIDIPTGTVKPNTAAITIEAAKIYSIANTLAACVNDAAGFANCGTLYTNTTPLGGTAPTDTLQAAVQMALYPYQNVQNLYQLASKTPPFTGLSSVPNDWTLGVSYTSSNYALSIAGTATSATSASIDIDANGKIWFPTNLSGSTGVAYFDPTSTTPFNGPYVTGALTQPQYVAIDTQGTIWVTDTASSQLGGTLTTDPADNASAGAWFVSGTVALGPIAADGADNVYFTSLDSTDTATLNGVFAETNAETFGVAYTHPPTGLAATFSQYGASTSGSSTSCANELIGNGGDTWILLPPYYVSPNNCTSGGFTYATQVSDGLSVESSLNTVVSALSGPLSVVGLNLPEGIALDGYGNEWVANSGNASVSTFGGSPGYTASSTVAYLHDAADGNTMTTPYAIAIDGSGNVWIANAGCVTTSSTACTPGAFVLSELIGAAGPTITPLSSQMVDDGYLVGYPPGTVPPVSESSAHPHRISTSRYGASTPSVQSQSSGTKGTVPFIVPR